MQQNMSSDLRKNQIGFRFLFFNPLSTALEEDTAKLHPREYALFWIGSGFLLNMDRNRFPPKTTVPLTVTVPYHM
jgi:hypothetical protein